MQTERTDTNEVLRIAVAESPYEVLVSRSRSFDHDHGHVTDICLITKRGATFEQTSLPAEHAEAILHALIDAHKKRKRWVEEGTNWNLGADGV